MKRELLIAALLICASFASGQEYSLMFYNTENLFDTVDDTLTADDEFLPYGDRRWTNTRYWKKLDAVASVIAAAGGWETPVIVGLCEVENSKVVSDLVYSSVLREAGYRFVHRDSPDPRGIDPAILYRSDVVSVIESRSWVPEPDDGSRFTSRNVLYAKCLLSGDTLHVIICHLPSRRGGVLAADETRKKVLALIGEKCDSLMGCEWGKAAVVVMGDFNSTPGETEKALVTVTDSMINTSAAAALKGQGSYRYRGEWEMIDQVIVSSAMCTGEEDFITGPGYFRVAELPFILEDDQDYPGKRPYSTYRGFTWTGGYSDHLPVLLTVIHR